MNRGRGGGKKLELPPESNGFKKYKGGGPHRNETSAGQKEKGINRGGYIYTHTSGSKVVNFYSNNCNLPDFTRAFFYQFHFVPEEKKNITGTLEKERDIFIYLFKGRIVGLL